ncbi:MAG: glycosyltransferase family 39 protein [Thermoleophilaceae bacterium]|nr:glycosyltransferase family 39 protein [Thermoleophilaceae bacterium]
MVRAVIALPSTVALRARLKRFGPLSGQRTWWALGGCLVLALVLRAPYLSTPLGRDEGGIAYIARNWPGGHGSLYGAYWLDRPPLLVGLFKIAVLGGDRGVRVLGALAAVALVVVIALLARAVAGPRAGRIAGLLAALLTGSASIGAVYTTGELLAAVPSTLSVLCLILAHRSRQARFVFSAGALAVGAALIKQSFLDAGVAGVAFVVVSAALNRDVRLRWPLAYGAGAAIPLGALLAWLAAAQQPLGGFIYALFGFRLDLLQTLAASDIPLHVRLASLAEPALRSGLVLAVAGAVVGLRHLRGDRVLVVTFSAWLAAATVGVLGGGSYFVHYLIELVPVSCVVAAVVIASARAQTRVAVLGVFTAVALTTAYAGAVYLAHHPPRRPELAVAHYVRDHAQPGDTQYVMYARPNVLYYAGLPSPYPYAWSLMVRSMPGARAQLQRLLGSTRRPTWLIQWQDDDRWQLDPGDRMDRLLARGYRLAAIVCGHPIYVRNDRAAPPRVTRSGCRGSGGLGSQHDVVHARLSPPRLETGASPR